ncbi:MAG: hypothetical protein SCK28_02360 [Bacillota bacterium]|nr:hypothetical protein [Bacillota bacterium]
MKRIRDKIMLGVISGLIAAVPGRILNEIEHQKGLIDMDYTKIASTLFMDRNGSNSREGLLLGNIVNSIMLSLTGVATTYTLSKTGKDYKHIKGIGLSYMYGIVLGGVMPSLGLVYKPKQKRSYSLAVIDHTLLGILCAELVSRLGAKEVFEDENQIE